METDDLNGNDVAATAPTIEELLYRIGALELERDEARRERDDARREADATERRVVAALAGDLAALARRARAEYANRLARGEGARFEQLTHHAQAFEYVAIELARKFGGEVADAIAPPEPPATDAAASTDGAPPEPGTQTASDAIAGDTIAGDTTAGDAIAGGPAVADDEAGSAEPAPSRAGEPAAGSASDLGPIEFD